MMLFQFFNLGHHFETLKKWSEDPTTEAYGYVQGVFFVYIQKYVLSLIFVLAVTALFAFSSVAGGPYILARILFYVTLVFFFIASFALWFIFSRVKKYADELSEKYKRMMSEEADYYYVKDDKLLE